MHVDFIDFGTGKSVLNPNPLTLCELEAKNSNYPGAQRLIVDKSTSNFAEIRFLNN